MHRKIKRKRLKYGRSLAVRIRNLFLIVNYQLNYIGGMVMFKRIMANLFSGTATRKYPKETREPFANCRGCIDVNISDCIFCGICERKCPSSAIKVDKIEKAWEIDPFKCIVCNLCHEECPKKCIISSRKYTPPNSKRTIIKRKKEA